MMLSWRAKFGPSFYYVFRFVTMQLRHNRVKKERVVLTKKNNGAKSACPSPQHGLHTCIVHLPQKYISQAEHSILTYLIYEIQYLYPVPLYRLVF